jgi:hypothetical protein
MRTTRLLSAKEGIQRARRLSFTRDDWSKKLSHARHLVRQLSALRELEKTLNPRPDQLEHPQLLFDRLMLAISREYLATRETAQHLGVSLFSSALSNSRSIAEFRSDTTKIGYTPLRDQLDWILASQKGRNFKEKEEELSTLARFAPSAYHELNHAIFFTLIRPRGLSLGTVEMKSYFCLAEALVKFRDIELAQHLGVVAAPLKAIGLIYESATNIEFGELAQKRDFSSFRRLLGSLFLHLSGFKKSDADRTFKQADISEAPVFGSDASRPFVDDLIPAWISEYQKKNGSRLQLPPLPKGAKPWVLNARFSAPHLLLKDYRFMDSLYKFYAALFWTQKSK